MTDNPIPESLQMRLRILSGAYTDDDVALVQHWRESTPSSPFDAEALAAAMDRHPAGREVAP